MPANSQVHFKVISSIGENPIFYTLLVYGVDSSVPKGSRYSTLSAAIAAAAAVSLPSGETFGGMPGQSTYPNGPISSPPNPTGTTS
jgi:hypothetical protein